MSVSKKIVIVDCGIGNFYSVYRAVAVCGGDPVLTSDPKAVITAEKVILPGVGAFPSAMNELSKRGLVEPILEFASKKKPILGICLGMQLFFNEGEEFKKTKGLGILPGKVIPLPNAYQGERLLKVPNIGWYSLIMSKNEKSAMGYELNDKAMYFVHSFMVSPSNTDCIKANYRYGEHMIPAIIQNEFVIGCQFHPEKSGKDGLKIIKNFIRGI